MISILFCVNVGIKLRLTAPIPIEINPDNKIYLSTLLLFII